MERYMQRWPHPDKIRLKAREQLLWARARRNRLIAEREDEKNSTRPRLRNLVLTAREDTQQRFARTAARFYRAAEQRKRGAT